MKRRTSGGGGGDVVVVVLVAVLVLANCVNAQIYLCWGGCYNDCFLRRSTSGPEELRCYIQCLNNCFPRFLADYQHYCQIGCSLEQCSTLIPFPYTDGARMDKCIDGCNDRCTG